MKADPCGCRSGSTVLQPGMFLVASFQNGANLFAECCTPRAVFTRIPGLEKKQPSSQKDEQQKARDLCLFTNNEKSIIIIPKRFSIFFTIFVPRVPYSVPVFYTGTFCTIFSRMPGFEPELLRQQPGVLPMSNTHSIPSHFLIFICFPDRTCRPHTSAPLWGD